MSVMTRAQFKRQLQEGLNAVFGIEYKRYPQQWKKIFTTHSSKKAFEEDVLSVGLGAAAVKAEGAGVTYDAGAEGFRARYDHVTIALAFAITEEAVEDGLYGSLGARYSKAMARSMQHTKEVRAADVLNNGHSASYPGGDGVALFSTAHPLNGGGTLSNKLATAADFSETAIEDMAIQIDGWTDDRGIPVDVRIKCAILPKELRFEAQRILMSMQQPGTANNDTNALRDLNTVPDVAVNIRLTDPDQWNLITDSPDGLKHFSRVAMQRGMEGDFETGNSRYKARERYVFGWTDPRGAAGSEGN